MPNSSDWTYPPNRSGSCGLWRRSPLVLPCRASHPRLCHVAGDTLARLVLPPLNSPLFQHTGAPHEQANRIWHCCLWQSQAQYGSPFYHGGYLWEVSKDALNFSPTFCENQSGELSWRINGTPHLAGVCFCGRKSKGQQGKMFFTHRVKSQRLQCGFELTSDQAHSNILLSIATTYHERHLLKCLVGAQIHCSTLKYRHSGRDLQKHSVSRITVSIKKRCSVLQKKSWGTQSEI